MSVCLFAQATASFVRPTTLSSRRQSRCSGASHCCCRCRRRYCSDAPRKRGSECTLTFCEQTRHARPHSRERVCASAVVASMRFRVLSPAHMLDQLTSLSLSLCLSASLSVSGGNATHNNAKQTQRRPGAAARPVEGRSAGDAQGRRGPAEARLSQRDDLVHLYRQAGNQSYLSDPRETAQRDIGTDT
eukprot:COSAG06_NODE_6260_length_3009_cov_7.058559_2_plen_188_part_00